MHILKILIRVPTLCTMSTFAVHRGSLQEARKNESKLCSLRNYLIFLKFI